MELQAQKETLEIEAPLVRMVVLDLQAQLDQMDSVVKKEIQDIQGRLAIEEQLDLQDQQGQLVLLEERGQMVDLVLLVLQGQQVLEENREETETGDFLETQVQMEIGERQVMLDPLDSMDQMAQQALLVQKVSRVTVA